VKRFEGRPFAIVGVNTGDDEKAFRKGVQDHGLSWISAYQGGRSPISDLYRVDGYPTMLVVDHEGKILFRDYGIDDDGRERFEADLELWVRAAEATGKK